MLADCGASLLIAWRALRTLDEPAWLVAPGSFFDDAEPVAAVEREAGDTAVIVYTSGTTAEPKGVELTHENLLANARVTAELFAYGGSDAVLAALPLAHAFGQTCTLNAPLLAGAAVVLADRFGVDDGVTVLVGVPSMYARSLADGARGTPSLRLCVSGGAPLAPELLDACEQTVGVRLLEGYGLTETSPVARSTGSRIRAGPARSARPWTASRCG